MSEQQEGMQLATFGLGDTLWGIDSNRIMEIIRVPEITRLYRVAESILGVINIRGRIVTVIDLGLRLGLEASRRDDKSRVVIVRWRDEDVGLLVDRVEDVLSLDEEDNASDEIPDDLKGRGIGNHFIDGIYQKEESLIAILQVDSVLTIEEAVE